MLNLKSRSVSATRGGLWRRRALSLTLLLLATEFLDEFIFGAREAAWPLIRNDLRLSYTEIGLLLSLPAVFGHLVEPALGILADIWKRRALILGGGIVLACGLLLTFGSYSFPLLIVAFALLSPASGAFVGLSQAALMDAAPEERERNMARWELAGSLGNVVAPLVLSLALTVGAGGRSLYAGQALFALLLVAAAWRVPFDAPLARREHEAPSGLREGLRGVVRALRRREVWRWLVLLELADLLMDGLHAYLALYFVDVVGLSETKAGLALVVWTCAGLPGDILLLPLLKRVRGLSYLRVSACVMLLLFPLFLLAPGAGLKLVVLGLIGFGNAGWYAIMKAQLYDAMEGRSGTVMTLSNVSGLFNGLIPLGLGLVAERLGLATAMWLLILGPLALLFGVPRESK
ncbi:MAG: MFS transporter [Acidobacteria bacterium]|nr:MFS transporter [Acidobacteriota bacterium]